MAGSPLGATPPPTTPDHHAAIEAAILAAMPRALANFQDAAGQLLFLVHKDSSQLHTVPAGDVREAQGRACTLHYALDEWLKAASASSHTGGTAA